MASGPFLGLGFRLTGHCAHRLMQTAAPRLELVVEPWKEGLWPALRALLVANGGIVPALALPDAAAPSTSAANHAMGAPAAVDDVRTQWDGAWDAGASLMRAWDPRRMRSSSRWTTSSLR
jgi:hypothetical protein